MKTSFDEFFRAVWGFAPFRWQSRLAETVASEGWPRVVDVPTGAGKTSVLDVALYDLARDGGARVPRRIVLVVDRRVIVDQVGERAARLREALERPEHPATREVAERLREMVGGGAPLLQSTVLRGASVRDDAWAKWPQVPVIAASTVDQVGSRLLFRGYGVSTGMRPVHAGLLGCDTLFLLDEVHLSRPFAGTLEQIEALRGGEREIPRRFGVVELSATPRRSRGKVFRLLPSDRDPSAGDGAAELDRRLSASKPARLVRVDVRATATEESKRKAVAQEAAKQARALVEKGRRAVAVVVNRVDTARRAWALLSEGGAGAPYECALLTGRMRPFDQAEIIRRIAPRVLSGREDRENEKPIVLVATQCIEAGADFDFDGMVTECASLDALRQRFGRVDRRGLRGSESVILCRKDLLGRVGDPVYGEALAKTFTWLETIAGGSDVVDFGIDALAPALEKLGESLEEYCAPSREAPVLLPAYLDQWAQTQPRPYADPDISLFLHGIPGGRREALPDVQVVFRADLTAEDLERANTDDEAWKRIVESIEVVPPSALESLSLPVWTVRSWLSKAPTNRDDVADVEGLIDEEESGWSGSMRPFLVWPTSEEDRRKRPVSARTISPGDVVVVPASYGGLGEHGTFDPDVEAPVVDLGDVVQLVHRGRASLRLDERVLAPFLTDEAKTRIAAIRHTDEEFLEPGEVREAFEALLRGEGWVDGVPEWVSPLRDALEAGFKLVSREMPRSGTNWAAIARRRSTAQARLLPFADDASESTTEGDEGSFLGRRVSLDAHLRGVLGVASKMVEHLAWPDRVARSIEWAARLHDVGKADPRFQLMLHGGDEIDAASAELLAKSPVPRQDAAARRLAREKAGYPAGQRHELVSLDMIERSPELRARIEESGADWELVLHLVASHHGWCRPFAPSLGLEGEGEGVSFVVDGIELAGKSDHARDRLDSGVGDRFFRLMKRYGWHELAYAEAVLRLADHRRSEMEQGGVK